MFTRILNFLKGRERARTFDPDMECDKHGNPEPCVDCAWEDRKLDMAREDEVR